ncbi:MAG: nitroreductase family protein [Eggerthellaceae bacterium]
MPSFIEHLSRTTRSFRRFRESYPVTETLMTQWVNNARVTASAANKQPLRYRIVTESDQCARVFDTLSWAAALPDWDGPKEGERPTGYIVMAVDSQTFEGELWRFDAGIAAQTIMLASTEEGFGGCMILSFKRKQIKEILDMPEGLEPVLVLALGRPIEDVRLVDAEGDDTTYYRNENQVHFVPKRRLEDVLF